MPERRDGDEIYLKLREFLDRLPGGFPSTQSGLDIRCLKGMFTPEQAEIEVHIRSAPERVAAIARRCGKPEAETEKILESMVRDGLIFPLKLGDKNYFMVMQYIAGFGENQLSHRLNPELARVGLDYSDESGLTEAFAAQRQMRVVPVNEVVEATAMVATYDRLRDTIREQETIAVTPCPCRVLNETLGKKCEHEVDNELSFGFIAEYRIGNGFGRKIGVEEALRIIDEAEETGLVLAPINTQETIAMCLCGGCCCQWLRGLKMYDRPADYVQSSFQARIDPARCNSCGNCLKRCQMEAIVEKKNTMEVNLARCIGCGLCLSKCFKGAVSMQPKPGVRKPEPTYLGLCARMAGERDLPLGKLRWLMNRFSIKVFIKEWKLLHRLHLAEPLINHMAKRGII